MTSHRLSLVAEEAGGTCKCGETFTGEPEAVLEAWQKHVTVQPLLAEARDCVLREYAARAQGEDAILTLHALGVSARAISDAIGTRDDGTALVSPTLVQRLTRGDHVQSPRRRRRATS